MTPRQTKIHTKAYSARQQQHVFTIVITILMRVFKDQKVHILHNHLLNINQKQDLEQPLRRESAIFLYHIIL